MLQSAQGVKILKRSTCVLKVVVRSIINHLFTHRIDQIFTKLLKIYNVALTIDFGSNHGCVGVRDGGLDYRIGYVGASTRRR